MCHATLKWAILVAVLVVFTACGGSSDKSEGDQSQGADVQTTADAADSIKPDASDDARAPDTSGQVDTSGTTDSTSEDSSGSDLHSDTTSEDSSGSDQQNDAPTPDGSADQSSDDTSQDDTADAAVLDQAGPDLQDDGAVDDASPDLGVDSSVSDSADAAAIDLGAPDLGVDTTNNDTTDNDTTESDTNDGSDPDSSSDAGADVVALVPTTIEISSTPGPEEVTKPSGPLVVVVKDQNGDPVADGTMVYFKIVPVDGAEGTWIAPDPDDSTLFVVQTKDGKASATLILGQVAKTHQIEAYFDKQSATPKVSFQLSALAGPKAKVVATPADLGDLSVDKSHAVTVLVTDKYGNPVPQTGVLFVQEGTDGSLSKKDDKSDPASQHAVLTDANGNAMVYLNMLGKSGVTYTVRAEIDILSQDPDKTAKVSGTSIHGAPVFLKLTGNLLRDEQHLLPGASYTITATVTDGFSNPVPNASVLFSSNGEYNPAKFGDQSTSTKLTDGNGVTNGTFTVDDQNGSHSVITVSVGSVTPQERLFVVVVTPDTGQTTCYKDDGTTLPCLSTPPTQVTEFYGQDADVIGPSPSYETHEVESLQSGSPNTKTATVITDKRTGLQWIRIHAQVVSQNNNGTDCNTLKTDTNPDGVVDDKQCLDGSAVCDWRLPTLRELMSLGNFDTDVLRINPLFHIPGAPARFYIGEHLTLDGVPFPETIVSFDGHPMVMSYNIGAVGGDSPGAAMLCVRGKRWAPVTLDPTANGECDQNYDPTTGLIWLDSSLVPGNLTWKQALDYCEQLRLGTVHGGACGTNRNWRLPNVNEMASLLLAQQTAPESSPLWVRVKPTDSDIENVSYWTSTTRSGSTDNQKSAYIVDFDLTSKVNFSKFAFVDVADKSTTHHAHCVADF